MDRKVLPFVFCGNEDFKTLSGTDLFRNAWAVSVDRTVGTCRNGTVFILDGQYPVRVCSGNGAVLCISLLEYKRRISYGG